MSRFTDTGNPLGRYISLAIVQLQSYSREAFSEESYFAGSHRLIIKCVFENLIEVMITV
jgi:hypothetical protein